MFFHPQKPKSITVSFSRTTSIPSPRESRHFPVHLLPPMFGFIKIKRSLAWRFLNNSSCWRSFKSQVIKDTNEKEKSWCLIVKQKGFENYVIEAMLQSTERENTLAFF